MFKKSPLKNCCLQKYLKEEFGKEMHLILDIKTRWNSMVAMIYSFLKAKNAIKKTLIDFELANLWNDQHVPVLEMLVEVLTPVKDAVEALSRRDSNLLIADAIMNTLFDQLLLIKSSFSQALTESIKEKISQRRDDKMLALISYLKNPDNFNANSKTSKSSLKLYAEPIYKRLFDQSISQISSSDDDISETQVDDCFKMKLKTAIDNAKANPKKPKSYQANLLKKEFDLYEASNIRTKNLDDLYNALLTIKPTSVDSERVFSVAGNFVTKIRNRMSNELLNALVVLKTNFLTN